MEKIFKSHEILKLNSAEMEEQVKQQQPIIINTSQGQFELALQPHDMRAKHYRAEATGPGGTVLLSDARPVNTFKGTVRGLPDAQARFTLNGESFQGIIITRDEIFAIEPARNFSQTADSTEYVFYRASEVMNDAATACGVALDHAASLESGRANAPEAPVAAGASIDIEIATEADYEYYQARGSNVDNVNSYITGILNQVEGIYQRDLNISLSIVWQHVWFTPNDPYNSTNPDTMLNEFANHWNANTSDHPRDLAHMWTGKDMDGSTVGIAWVGSACRTPVESYGVSQKYESSLALRDAITAHEIGHNIGAGHSDGNSGCSGTIMQSTVGTGPFCQFSRDQIASFINAYGSCLTNSGYTIGQGAPNPQLFIDAANRNNFLQYAQQPPTSAVHRWDCATCDPGNPSWGKGLIQDFDDVTPGVHDALMLADTNTSFVVQIYGGMWDKLLQLGGLNYDGSNTRMIGYPLADRNCSDYNAACFADSQLISPFGTSYHYQRFQGGTFVMHRSGSRNGQTFEVHGAIRSRWQTLGGPGSGSYGLPITDEYAWQGKRRSDFEGGSICFNSTTNQTEDGCVSTVSRTLTVASSNPGSGVSITISPNDNSGLGSGTTQFTRTYNNNASVNLTAPSTAGGNNFQKWQRDGADWSFSQATSVVMDASHTMTAIYTTPPPVTRTLTVASSNPASGVSITLSPADNFGQGSGMTQFARTYNNNTSISLTAPSTAGGNVFQKWQRNGIDFGNTQTVSLMMDANYTLTAVYGTVTGAATYDATLKAPKCGQIGSVCDSGTLLDGRDNIEGGPEPNQPNTIYNSCADSTAGSYHLDESNDRLKVSTLDGSNFAPGKTVKIEATVWAWSGVTSDFLDLYYAPDATNPNWTYLATLVPSGAGVQVLSINYALPSGGSLQAVRAHFRYSGTASACGGGGSWDDYDDLIFAASTGGGMNYALATNGGVASASSTSSSSQFPGYNFSPAVTIDGDRKSGVNFWRDDTANTYPDWLQVDFNGQKNISEIDVFTLQDNDQNPSEPTQAMTFSINGITAFDVQYWTGSAWITVPGGSVTGNNLVWRKFTFSPITTTKIRVLVNNALNTRSRIVELEAWDSPTTTLYTNYALGSNGGVASASSTSSNSPFPGYNFSPTVTTDGDRKSGVNFWRDDTANIYPDWLQVDFNGQKNISEIDVFTLQDNDQNPSEPTQAMTFSLNGITAFDVQYWTGSSWATVPNGSVSGNNLVWRKFTFSPVNTSAVRVLVNNALNSRSRVVELEAWGTASTGTNHALAFNGGVASASSTSSNSQFPGYNFSPAVTIDGDRKSGVNFWRDDTANAYPDWLQVDFNGQKNISEIDVFTLQDNDANPAEPTQAMTFSINGITAFDVQYWTGSAWITVPGGSVTGNNLVWRKFTFSPINTNRIRVLVNGALNTRSRIVEVEAWGN